MTKIHPQTRPFFTIGLVANIAGACISQIPVNLNTQLHFQIAIIQMEEVCSVHPHYQAPGQAKIIPEKIESFAASGDTLQR